MQTAEQNKEQLAFAPGDSVPWFATATHVRKEFHFDTVAGRYLVLCFYGSTKFEVSRKIIEEFYKVKGVFDDINAAFFAVCLDKEDIEKDKIKQKIPGYRVFFDFEGRISKGYKALHEGSESLRPYTLLIDPNMRVLKAWSFDSPRTHVNEVVEFIKNLPPMKATEVPAQMQAPVLVLPRILEPELCHELIAYYDKKGGYDSGFMRQQGEKTVGIVDHGFKRRDDCMIEEEELRKVIRDHITRRLTPQIRKAFQFNATHMERYLVARYDSVSGGFFRAHRDNTTKATAHRKFAVTLNLNAEDYEGGDLMFPEFGWQRYRAPTGGCVVFSCSVLHEAMPVTKDARYAFLPFLYDEAGAKLREENIKFLATESTKEKEEYVK